MVRLMRCRRSVGQSTFHTGRFDATNGYCVASTGNVQNGRFGIAFYHIKRTEIRWLQFQSKNVTAYETVGLRIHCGWEVTRRPLIPRWTGMKRSDLLCKTFCIASTTEVRGPRRCHWLCREAKREPKQDRLVWCALL